MSDNGLVSLTIDGTSLKVPKGTLVIRAAEQLGITIPRFCDHPLLDPVAACRQCLVEVEGQRKPMTACSTTCTPDMVVKTHLTSDAARRDQEAQLEFLLINHPLDCPMCDKGGECPLQDQALAHGPGDSRFIDQKRRYAKPVPISPQVALDRERCVLCARCTRFSQEISGDPFIELFERGALEQVAIYADEPYHSYYSGNVVQICPVGALTSTSYRFGSRPFDLRSIDGVCNQCNAGCNLRVDIRAGEIQRQLARENMAVNEMWTDDKCRFGYEFVAHPDRLVQPRVRSALGSVEQASWQAALRRAAEGLRAALDAGGPGAVGVLTGGRITDEDAYALSRFARGVLGTDNVDFRLRPRTDEERDVLAAISGMTGPTFADVEAAPLVVVVGLDPEEEAPLLHLRLRKAWRANRQRILVVGPVLGSLEGIAWRWVPTAVGDEARVLRALAGDAEHGDADGLDEITSAWEKAAAGGSLGAGASPAGGSLGAGASDGPVVLAGERLAESPGGLRAAARLGGTRFAWVPRKNNARGAVDAGLMPGLLPGGRTLADPGPVVEAWGRVPDEPGLDTRGMLEAAAAGDMKALYLVGVDPVRDFEDPRLARAALEREGLFVIAQDLMATESVRYADVILPAAAPQERVGSFTNWEGRRQAFPQAVPPRGLSLQDWDIVRQLARALGTDLGWETAMDVRREAAPLMTPAGAAVGDLSAPGDGSPGEALHEPNHNDGTLTAVVLPWLIGRGTMLAGADALLATARPAAVWLNVNDASRLGVADGQTVAVTGPGGRLELPARVTTVVAAGAVVLPANSTDTTPGALAAEDAEHGAPLRVHVEPPVGAAAGAEQANEEAS